MHGNLLQKTDVCKTVPVNFIRRKLIFIEGNNNDYFCEPPNDREIEL